MENKLEMHEGLAEYTGHKICSGTEEEFKDHVLEAKTKYWNNASYMRSFAYYSGVLYGYLLDQGPADWKKTVKPDSDLGENALAACGITLPGDLEAAYNIARMNYDFEDILQVENERGKSKRQYCKHIGISSRKIRS